MPLQFIPARDPRHRRACLRLYKALLAYGARVPLPDSVPASPAIGSLKDLVRRGFRRNRGDTSSRLVISALRNGYEFLDMFKKAQVSPSPENDSLASFLTLNAPRLRSRIEATAAAIEARSTAPNPGAMPLLERISPVPSASTTGRRISVAYTRARPARPAGTFPAGVRRVPHLDSANGIPFLRLRKPQSRVLGRVLGQKIVRRQNRVDKLKQMEEEMPAARLEDQWEKAVASLAGHNVDLRESRFTEALRQSIGKLGSALTSETDDRIARGEALWKIVQEERALSEAERHGGQQPTPELQGPPPPGPCSTSTTASRQAHWSSQSSFGSARRFSTRATPESGRSSAHNSADPVSEITLSGGDQEGWKGLAETVEKLVFSELEDHRRFRVRRKQQPVQRAQKRRGRKCATRELQKGSPPKGNRHTREGATGKMKSRSEAPLQQQKPTKAEMKRTRDQRPLMQPLLVSRRLRIKTVALRRVELMLMEEVEGLRRKRDLDQEKMQKGEESTERQAEQLLEETERTLKWARERKLKRVMELKRQCRRREENSELRLQQNIRAQERRTLGLERQNPEWTHDRLALSHARLQRIVANLKLLNEGRLARERGYQKRLFDALGIEDLPEQSPIAEQESGQPKGDLAEEELRQQRTEDEFLKKNLWRAPPLIDNEDLGERSIDGRSNLRWRELKVRIRQTVRMGAFQIELANMTLESELEIIKSPTTDESAIEQLRAKHERTRLGSQLKREANSVGKEVAEQLELIELAKLRKDLAETERYKAWTQRIVETEFALLDRLQKNVTTQRQASLQRRLTEKERNWESKKAYLLKTGDLKTVVAAQARHDQEMAVFQAFCRRKMAIVEQTTQCLLDMRADYQNDQRLERDALEQRLEELKQKRFTTKLRVAYFNRYGRTSSADEEKDAWERCRDTEGELLPAPSMWERLGPPKDETAHEEAVEEAVDPEADWMVWMNKNKQQAGSKPGALEEGDWAPWSS